jgi:predicted nucleotidyltransferase
LAERFRLSERRFRACNCAKMVGVDAGPALDPQRIAERLARVPGVVAVTLGGSRAQGTHLPVSDWDFGLYYREHIDTEALRAHRWEGEVTEPGAWAYPMNGGAWLTIEGQKVDLLYRDLEDVERWVRRTERGEWELYRVPGYLAGFPSYALAAELALGRILIGSLSHPTFPAALTRSAPRRWRWEAGFALDHAEAHASRGETAACIGKCAYAILASAHAQLAEAGVWAINEKGLVERAGLQASEQALRQAASEKIDEGAVARVRQALTGDAAPTGAPHHDDG